MSTTSTPTSEQQDSIICDGNMVVISKPGSGKTFVISQKVRNIIPDLPDYKGVIAISYTNKASNELKSRCSANGFDVKSSFFGTIDSFCSREIVRDFIIHFWGLPEVEVSTIKVNKKKPEISLDAESMQQISVELIQDLWEVLKSHYTQGKIFLESQTALAVHILRNSKSCQRYIKSRYTHVFIDEYQDAGLEQHELFLELKKLGLISVAVGDYDQFIYKFSGKDSRFLHELSDDSEFSTFYLTINHRCHQSIIDYSSQVISDTDLNISPNQDLRIFEKIVPGNLSDVAKWIASKISSCSEKFDIKKRSDIGILFSGNKTGAEVSRNLSVNHKLFVDTDLHSLFGSWSSLFCRLLEYRLNENLTITEVIDESGSILTEKKIRQARRIIKDVRITQLENLFDSMIRVVEILSPNSRDEQAIESLDKIIRDGNLSSFTHAKDDEIQLMSIHKSKGLEFDVVFHLDLIEWGLPKMRPVENGDPVFPDLQQDINLHYVAITRAKKACVFCVPTKRFNAKGREIDASKSIFLGCEELIPLRKILK